MSNLYTFVHDHSFLLSWSPRYNVIIGTECFELNHFSRHCDLTHGWGKIKRGLLEAKRRAFALNWFSFAIRFPDSTVHDDTRERRAFSADASINCMGDFVASPRRTEAHHAARHRDRNWSRKRNDDRKHVFSRGNVRLADSYSLFRHQVLRSQTNGTSVMRKNFKEAPFLRFTFCMLPWRSER